MEKKYLSIMVAILLALFTSGCQVYQAAQIGAAIYQGGQGITGLYYSGKMLKSLRSAEPLFENYDAVKVETLVAPRNEDKAIKLTEAFKENMAYIVETDLKETGFNREICAETCPEKTIVVQFKEKGYDETIAQKIFMGANLRGTLYFIDKQAGAVIREESFEAVKNYDDLLRLFHISIATKALKSIEKKGDGNELQAAVNKVNKIDPIKNEYKPLFKES